MSECKPGQPAESKLDASANKSDDQPPSSRTQNPLPPERYDSVDDQGKSTLG